MSQQPERDELIERLAAEDTASRVDGADPTLIEFKAELETLESQIRQPEPPDPFADESACGQMVEKVAEMGRELSAGTLAELEHQAAAEAPPLGTLGQYQLVAKLGEGGMGAVYKAVHTRLERVVALKVLPKERLLDPQAVARFQREMRAVGKLQHPNIVGAHDAGEIDGTHYLVMELVEGTDLGKLVSEHGPLPINAACELIRQAALGLQHAYEHNLVHRDIKPSNLMLAAPASSKGSPTVKILDLGLALLEGSHLDAGELTSTGQVMGTLDYMAPEQGTDTHSVDIRADIYSLGASLYKLLTGRAPFGDPQYNSPIKKLMALANQAPKPIESLQPDCPPALSQLIARMLSKSPEERPTPPDELATLLEPFCQGADLHALLKPAAQKSTVHRQELTVRTQQTSDDPTFVPTGPVDAAAPTRVASTIGAVPPRRKRGLMLGLGGVAAALVMGVVIYIATDHGKIEIQGPEELVEQIQFKLLRKGEELKPHWQIKTGTGKVATVRSGNIDVMLPDDANEYELIKPDELIVRRGGTVVFQLRRIDRNSVPATVAQQPPAIGEPPPLADWLKGRKRLTVAQDGKAEFTTILAALKALKPGQVVQVLDKGPYLERIEILSVPADVGLISEARTIIEVKDLKPAGWKSGGMDVYEAHHLFDLDGFRLNGFHFVFPDAGELIHGPGGFVCSGLKVGRLGGLVVEDCRFEGHCASPTWDSLGLAFMENSSTQPVCIRDCVVEGGLRFDTKAEAEPPTILVTRNYVWKLTDEPERPNVKIFGAMFNKVVLHQNIFDGRPKGADLDFAGAANIETLEIRNNIFNSHKPILFQEAVPAGAITIENNLCTKPGIFSFWMVPDDQVKGAAKAWRVGRNSYPRPIDAAFPPGKGDISAREMLLSYERENRDYLRMSAIAPSARGGGIGYIGALTPGPAPAEGDWFTKLRQRWLRLEDPSTPTQIEEPPSLAEWLKDREVLTVAQDGSGKFKTIQEALKAVRAGQVVRVLDRGPYRERLDLHSPPSDIGLISDVQTVIVADDTMVSRDGESFRGHFMSDTSGFRVSGLHFIFPRDVPTKSPQKLPQGEGLSIDRPGGLVVENCWFDGLCESRDWDSLALRLFDGTDRRPICIRECLINGLRIDSYAPELREPSVTVVRNRLHKLGDEFRPRLKLFGSGAFGVVHIRHNVFTGPGLGSDIEPAIIKSVALLDITNNTLNGEPSIVITERAPPGQVSIQNNLCGRPGLVHFWKVPEDQTQNAFRNWQVGHNGYPRLTDTDTKERFPKCPGDLLERLTFLSDNAESSDYCRLPADSPAATAGAGGELPAYLGALAPRPGAAHDDWFTRLQERWSKPSEAISPAQIPEPPPLAEWLKGRKVLTVAQDGRAQFKTIQAALDALQEGQVVKILDRGPYREQLRLDDPLANVGIISECRPIIELTKWTARENGPSAGHLLRSRRALRLNGLAFAFAEPGEYAGLVLPFADGLVLENCQFKSPIAEKFAQWGAVRIEADQQEPGQPLVVRDCRFEGTLAFANCAANDALITRNYIMAYKVPIGLSGSMGTAVVRHNVMEGSPFSWLSVYQTGQARFIDISQNTFPGDAQAAITDAPPEGFRFSSNLMLGFGGVIAWKEVPAEAMDRLKIDHNYSELENRTGGGYTAAPKSPQDHVGTVRLLSRSRSNQNYLRPPKADPQNPNAVPDGVGALPTGPAPAEGDWFTRLQHSWFDPAPELAKLTTYREFAEWVQLNGGRIVLLQDGNPVDFRQGDPLPAGDLPIQRFYRIDLSGLNWIDDTVAEKLAACPALNGKPAPALDLRGTQISDVGLRALAKLDLRILAVGATHVTGVGFESFPKKSLQGLSIDACPITSEGWKQINALSGLVELYANRNEMTEVELAAIVQTHPKLAVLGLESTNIADNDLAVLAKASQLRSLDLRFTGTTDAAVAHLSKLTSLKSLDVRETKISEAAIAELRRALPGCEIRSDDARVIGRQVITVAQDGSGKFKSLQAALDQFQPGQVIKVLDKGTVREALDRFAHPDDARLKPRTLDDDYHPWAPPADLDQWKTAATAIRERMLVSNGLWPMPPKIELKPVIHGKIDRDDYTVEKVFFASRPGHYVSGNLYRPKKISGKNAGILCPYGHWERGRFYDAGEIGAKEQIAAGAEKLMCGARYPLQARMVQLARMGCVVFHYDMIAYGDSHRLEHREGFRDAEAELWLQNIMGLQTFNSIRALDFLQSLPDVDPQRIGVTGESGGGTQTMMLCGVDPRPAAAFPAVMVSTGMQGGCVCENAPYLRIGLNNVALSAVFAPKPLAMSGADDWTREIETKGLPELRQVYSLYGKPSLVTAKAFVQFKHNYNQVAREMMYGWFAQHLGLDPARGTAEREFDPILPAQLSVFDGDHPLPADAADAPRLRELMRQSATEQFDQLRPRDAQSLEEYRRIVGTAARVMLDRGVPTPEDLEVREQGDVLLNDGVLFRRLVLSRRGAGEQVPMVVLIPEGATGAAVLWVDGRGKGGLFSAEGQPIPQVQKLLAAKFTVASLDPFLTSEAGQDSRLTLDPKYPGLTYCYNRPLLAQRVRDILSGVAALQQQPGVNEVRLVGMGDTGPWALLARALAPNEIKRAVVDLRGFRFDRVKDLNDPMLLPGALRYGGIGGLAALQAPAPLTIAGARDAAPADLEILTEAYQAAGAKVGFEQGELTPALAVELIVK